MKRYVLIAALLIFIASCSSIDPLELVQANSQVQEFLEKYPDADVLMTKFGPDVTEENAVVSEICETSLEDKEYYKRFRNSVFHTNLSYIELSLQAPYQDYNSVYSSHSGAVSLCQAHDVTYLQSPVHTPLHS